MAHENDWVADLIETTEKTYEWDPKTWSGLTSFTGYNIWTDGNNIYYSVGSSHYVLDKETSTWSVKTWTGLTSFNGNKVWTDNDNVYYSYQGNNYVLNKTTSRWSSKTWKGLTYGPWDGGYVWTDGTNIYYSNGSDQYVLDKTTSTWSIKSWTGLTDFYGYKVWTDGTHIYYSDGDENKQYVLDVSSSVWTPKTWEGLTYGPRSGNYIWSDGENTFYTNGSGYILNKSTSAWEYAGSYPKWPSSANGQYVWGDGTNTYYSDGNKQYIFVPKPIVVSSVPYRLNFPKMVESIDIYDKWIAKEIGRVPTDTWITKDWGELVPIYGYYIWTDGTDIYFSYGTAHYVFNKQTSTWVTKTWYGLTDFKGNYVWTDGYSIYFSNGSKQYVLDKSTSTWSTKTWSGLTSFDGSDLWTDGNDIYHSFNNKQYVLNKQTSTWESKTWYGLANPGGKAIWTDGNSIYYSSSSYQYVLDKSTSTWSAKTWTGLTSFNGRYVWTDENDIYYSEYSKQYVLDKSTSTWSAKTWYGMDSSLSNFTADWIWTDGNKIYFSWTNNYQYELLPGREITSAPYRMNFPEMVESIDPNDSWLIDDNIPFRLDFPELIPSVDLNSWLIDDGIPFRRNFPPLIPSIDPDSWLIDDDIPFRLDFPPLIPSAVPSDSWLQDKGWDPRRPWPEHRSIIQKVQTIPNIPDVDWTKSMQQTFEFYTVDPNNWYDDQKLENIISCDLTHDVTSDKRGNASITVTESLPESYIRTYLVVTQAGYMHKICLGTYLYMTSSDSFDGMKHNITMTGYTPMVELEEKLPPLGFHIIGITNRKHSGNAPMVTNAIKDIVTTYTRCEIENRTVIQKPLLNDFVAGTNDNFLTVINNILNASSLQQYILTVDEWGTIIVKDKPVLEDAIPTYIYTDDNSSILLPSLDTNDDIYGIPNVVEVLYTGDKRLPAIRVIVKNEDPTSIVSIPARGREIAKRFTITNIAAPVNDYSEAAVRAQVTAQAERLLEAASTINKTISYSHGYCDVKVGDTVLINYERAGVTGIRAKVVSQRISCKPGCQVDEQAVYTKKLWNRGV